MTFATDTFLAAETFLRLLAMEDFRLGVKNCLDGVFGGATSSSSELEDLSPADSFMAFSNALTLSLMGEPE